MINTVEQKEHEKRGRAEIVNQCLSRIGVFQKTTCKIKIFGGSTKVKDIGIVRHEIL